MTISVSVFNQILISITADDALVMKQPWLQQQYWCNAYYSKQFPKMLAHKIIKNSFYRKNLQLFNVKKVIKQISPIHPIAAGVTCCSFIVMLSYYSGA